MSRSHGFDLLRTTGSPANAVCPWHVELMPRLPIGGPPVIRADALLRRGRQAVAEGRWEAAIAVLRRIVEADPTDREALNELALAYGNLGDPWTALSYVENSLRIDPRQPAMWQIMAHLMLRIGEPEQSLVCLDRLITLVPDLTSAHAQRADTLGYLGRFSESATAFRELEKLNPAYACGYGAGLTWCGRHEEALAAFDRAIAVPQAKLAAWMNKAMLLMRLGDLPTGLPLYERRWELLGPNYKHKSEQPIWLGDTSLQSQRLFIYWEQGIGDTLQFCRYAALAAKAGAEVILGVQQPLVRLMSTPDGVSRIVGPNDKVPDHDLRCPMMSLPLAFGTTIETIPAEIPYLHADPADVAVWQQRLQGTSGKRVGLVWAGEARIGAIDALAADKRRSTTLAALAPLAAVSGCAFFSLQLGPAADQAAHPPEGMILRDFTSELKDFADTAGLIENLDLVISVDTAPAHLAGAMGKPVLLLNRFDTCWRWFFHRADTDWYPSMRIFRQPAPHDWATPIQAAADALRVFAAT